MINEPPSLFGIRLHDQAVLMDVPPQHILDGRVVAKTVLELRQHGSISGVRIERVRAGIGEQGVEVREAAHSGYDVSLRHPLAYILVCGQRQVESHEH